MAFKRAAEARAIADEFKDCTPEALAAAIATAKQFSKFIPATPADITEVVYVALLAFASELQANIASQQTDAGGNFSEKPAKSGS